MSDAAAPAPRLPIEAELRERHGRYVRGAHARDAELYATLARGQAPRVLFVACSDSRVVPATILDADPGDVFVCQIVGNVVPPYGTGGAVAVTVEYAVTMLEVEAIVVCGHSGCGAMAALAHVDRYAPYPAITSWLANAEAARRVVDAERDAAWPEERVVARLIEANVVAQLEHLETHPAVAVGRRRGLVLLGWIYDIATGGVAQYDPATGNFVPLAGA